MIANAWAWALGTVPYDVSVALVVGIVSLGLMAASTAPLLQSNNTVNTEDQHTSGLDTMEKKGLTKPQPHPENHT